MEPAAARKALAEWHADAGARVSKLQAFAYGPAVVASTREEAVATIAAASVPLVPLRLDADGALLRGNIGRLLLLAGRNEDALAYLRAAAADCGPLDDAFSAVRAHAWLAEALETTGDVAGACKEYRVVLERWGTAKKSVTADRARARRKVLKCAP